MSSEDEGQKDEDRKKVTMSEAVRSIGQTSFSPVVS